MYLEKQLISSIEVVKPDYINVPAVSFCFPLGVIYNESSAPSNELLKSIGVACDQAKKYKSACRHKKKTITPYYDTLDDRWNASKQEEDDRIRMEDSIRSNRECFGKILAVVEATPDSNITSSLRGLIFEFFQLVETVSYLSSSDYSMVKFEPQPAFDKAFVTPLPLRGKSLGCYKLSLDAESKKSFERHNVSKISPVFLEIEFNRDLVQNLSDIEIYVHPSNTEPLATDYRFVVNSENSYQLALETYEYSFATELFDQPCRDHGEKRRAHLVSDCIESMRRKNMSLAEKTCYEEFPNDCFLTEYKPKATKVVNGGGPLKG
ncbi:hypothetical protein HDE_12114 [Halotydeus destructor]|nr:hypothetical protein HDE_12114 [Halotydeus destructor]